MPTPMILLLFFIVLNLDLNYMFAIWPAYLPPIIQTPKQKENCQVPLVETFLVQQEAARLIDCKYSCHSCERWDLATYLQATWLSILDIGPSPSAILATGWNCFFVVPSSILLLLSRLTPVFSSTWPYSAGGHLTFQCRNFVRVDPKKDVVVDVSSTSSEDESGKEVSVSSTSTPTSSDVDAKVKETKSRKRKTVKERQRSSRCVSNLVSASKSFWQKLVLNWKPHWKYSQSF